jgi:Holliday junction resolvase-like predicted endonuclease
MKVIKSTRHAKITGGFGEALVLYWLSKYGFECALVDHTGIDIIARNPHSREVMGISVKSRSRKEGTEQTYVLIANDNFRKVDAACQAFNCIPYFAIVVDEEDTIRVFIISKDRLLACCPMRKLAAGWKMTARDLKRYAEDSEIKAFEFKTKTARWRGQ